jgi:hypothetical protein
VALVVRSRRAGRFGVVLVGLLVLVVFAHPVSQMVDARDLRPGPSLPSFETAAATPSVRPDVPQRGSSERPMAGVVGNEDTVIGEIPVPSVGGFPPLYDPATGDLYVAEFGGTNLTVLDPANNTTVGTLPIGSGGGAVVLDPTTGDLWVANLFSGNLTEVDPATGHVVRSVAIGDDPGTPAFDPSSGALYVPYEADPLRGAWNVSVVDGSDGVVVANVPVGGPGLTQVQTPTYDPADGDLYAALDSDPIGIPGLAVISGATNTTVGNLTGPTGLFAPTYDPADSDLYVSATGSVNLTVLSGSNGSVVAQLALGNGTASPAYDPASQTMLAPASSGSSAGVLAVVSSGDPSIVALVPTPVGPGTPVYDATNDEVYLASAGPALTAVNATTWAPPIGIALPSSASTPAVGPGVDGVYAALPFAGNVSVVDDQPLEITNFTVSQAAPAQGGPLLVTDQFLGGVGALAFEYSGLPTGCVGANETGLQCTVPTSGTYRIALSITDEAAERASASASIELVAPPATYEVTFAETGLPAGTGWGVFFEGMTNLSNGTSVGFRTGNGTQLPFLVSYPMSLVSANPAMGYLVVSGHPVTVAIVFALLAAPSAGGPSATALDEEYALAGAVLLAGVVTMALYLRGRGTRPPPTVSSDEETEDDELDEV